jgi:hypothetical protein
MEAFLLKQFFLDMLNLSYEAVRPGWGNPCSYLLERLILRQEPFLDKIMGDYTNNSHEMRLNGAGLKLWWCVYRDGDNTRFTCHIGGDQAREYPFFVDRVEKLIKKYKFNRR